jgi:hypothetical protein
MRNVFGAVVGLVVMLGLGACGSDGSDGKQPQQLTVVEPAEGAVITTYSFTVRIEAGGAVAAGSVQARLNGEPVELTAGPGVFTASFDPGPPLRDDCVLEVTARLTGGSDAAVRRTFRYLPPKARARRISDAADLIHGPLAHSRLGDYLLANDKARFVIQDAPQRDLWSVGAFGGNIIDAELVGHPGLDNFLEIQPALNIETVINAQTVEIVNDGQDGTAAIIRTCGPDDLLDFVNPSTIIEGVGLSFPAAADDKDYDVDGCTEYALEPDTTYVRMTTTIFNNEEVERGFFVGDYLNGSGELEQWTTSGGGIGELLTNVLGIMSYIGYGEATGVDYSHLNVPLPESPIQRSTFFSTAGVSYIMHSHSIIGVLAGNPPTFVVPAQGSNSFTRFFGVGDGSGGNAIAMQSAVEGTPTGTIRGCVTLGGSPAPAARVSVVRSGLASQYVTGPDGCYRGLIPTGTYQVAAAVRGAMYEDGGSTPTFHTVTITEGAVTTQDIALPATGRVRVQITDPSGEPLPGRVSVIGFDPSPETTMIVRHPLGSDVSGVFNDVTRDPVPFGMVWMQYSDANGVVEFDLEPGTYELAVSRGVEYSLFRAPLTSRAGETTMLEARLARVVDTSGFVSSDYHVHGINSADARVSHTDRVMQFAGEGVDNIIMTDHHSHTDLTPRITALGFEPFVHATIGEEITTWDYGHFNAYPLRIDPSRPSGGSTDWAGAAPPGRDFPAYGAFSLTPAQILAEATTGSTSTPDTTIQINHIDSFFLPLQIDTALVPPRSFISPETKLAYRLDPSSGNLFHHFPALEVWNGSGRGAQAEFLNNRMGIWMNHLNQGLLTTAIADTDTHSFRNLETAGARTWTASPTDDATAINPSDITRAVDAGRAMGGQGVYVQARLLAMDGSSGVADLSWSGSTLVRSTNGDVDLEITVQAPLWAPYDRIEIYANARTTVSRRVDNVPVLYGAEPTRVLTAGTDFAVEFVDVVGDMPEARRRETRVTLPFRNLPADTWFVIVVKGTDAISAPMFPVFPQDLRRDTNTSLADLLDGNLGESGVLALGFTNALYADVDGVPGFNAPMAP